jgi:hypothetical protein
MPTRSPVPIPPAATPAALGTAAPRSSARAVYLAQKRDVAARRGAEIIGPGVAVPRLTCADALALVAWWAREVPALAAGGRGDADPDVAAWARCALDVRARATTPAAAGQGAAHYPAPDRLWHCIKRVALALDARGVAPRNANAAELAGLAAQVARAASDVRTGAADASHAIGTVSDALAAGAAKVSGAAGRGAGEGAIKGALSAAAVPAAIAGVALVGGFVLWRATRGESRNDNHAPTSTRPRAKKKRAKTGGRS